MDTLEKPSDYETELIEMAAEQGPEAVVAIEGIIKSSEARAELVRTGAIKTPPAKIGNKEVQVASMNPDGKLDGSFEPLHDEIIKQINEGAEAVEVELPFHTAEVVISVVKHLKGETPGLSEKEPYLREYADELEFIIGEATGKQIEVTYNEVHTAETHPKPSILFHIAVVEWMTDELNYLP